MAIKTEKALYDIKTHEGCGMGDGLKSIVTKLDEKCSFCFRDSELSKVFILKGS